MIPDPSLVVFLACLFVALGTGVLAGLSDLRTMTIPNLHSVIVAAAFGVCYGVLSLFDHADVFAPLLSHGLAALLVFMITAAMFAFKALGAADSKLATAYALWVGLGGLPPFLFYMALCGAVLGLAALALRKWKPVKAPAPGSWIAQVQSGASKVPYGVAIVIGALAAFLELGYLGSAVLGSFVVP